MEKILYQLDLLEEYFYDNIDYSLLQHPDLCNFAIQLEKIKHTITYELTHPNANTHANANTNIDLINTEQLNTLSLELQKQNGNKPEN